MKGVLTAGGLSKYHRTLAACLDGLTAAEGLSGRALLQAALLQLVSARRAMPRLASL